MSGILNISSYKIKTTEDIKNALIENVGEYSLEEIRKELNKILKKDSIKVAELSNDLRALKYLYTNIGVSIRATRKYEIILNDVNSALEIIKENNRKEQEEREKVRKKFKEEVVNYCYNHGVNKIEMLFGPAPNNTAVPFCDRLTGHAPDEIFTQGRVYSFADYTFSRMSCILNEYERARLTEEEAVKEMIDVYLYQFLGGFYRLFNDNFCEIRGHLKALSEMDRIGSSITPQEVLVSIERSLLRNYDFEMSNTPRKKVFTLFDATEEEVYGIVYKCTYGVDMLPYYLKDLFITKFLNYVCRYVCCYRTR